MSSLRTYLQLMRFPAVFTAMADILLGFLLNHDSFQHDLMGLGLLLVSSSCLYLAGMVLNDVFDREVDARERPNRPIPFGPGFGDVRIGHGRAFPSGRHRSGQYGWPAKFAHRLLIDGLHFDL